MFFSDITALTNSDKIKFDIENRSFSYRRFSQKFYKEKDPFWIF